MSFWHRNYANYFCQHNNAKLGKFHPNKNEKSRLLTNQRIRNWKTVLAFEPAFWKLKKISSLNHLHERYEGTSCENCWEKHELWIYCWMEVAMNSMKIIETCSTKLSRGKYDSEAQSNSLIFSSFMALFSIWIKATRGE